MSHFTSTMQILFGLT